MTITSNQINAIAAGINAEYNKLPRMERMTANDAAIRAKVFANYPKAVVDAYIADERKDHAMDARRSDTKGTF